MAIESNEVVVIEGSGCVKLLLVTTGFFLCQTTFQRNVAHAREMWPEMWPIMPRAMYFVEIPITMRRFSLEGKYCTCQTLTLALKHIVSLARAIFTFQTERLKAKQE